jgi:hypothetical protein
MRKMAIVTLVLGIAGLLVGRGWAAQTGIKSQDEGPIIVQNGSMTVDTTEGGKWQGGVGVWKNVTGKDHKGDLWVRIDLKGGTSCKGSASGHPVHVKSSAGFNTTINVAAKQTVVAPRGGFTREMSDTRLRHAGSGHITSVDIKGKPITCNITEDNLVSVNICSSPDVDKCK